MSNARLYYFFPKFTRMKIGKKFNKVKIEEDKKKKKKKKKKIDIFALVKSS